MDLWEDDVIERDEDYPPKEPTIVATSQTRWSKDLPKEWQEAALKAVVDAGYGDTQLVVVAIIACALWELVQEDRQHGDA